MLPFPPVGGGISQTCTGLPAPALRSCIAGYAGFRMSGLPPGTIVGPPSRHIDLIISLAAPITIVQMPARARPPVSHRALVGGLQIGPALIRQDSEAHGLHAFLRPSGLRSVLGVPSAELASRVVDLRDIWGPGATGLMDRLERAHTWPERFRILDEAFMARLACNPIAREIDFAWRVRCAAGHLRAAPRIQHRARHR